MLEDVLTPEQLNLARKLFPKIQKFYLAGGTALALQIGHRRSVDFDLASSNPVRTFDLERRIMAEGFKIQSVFTATGDEFSILIEDTKVTFFYFPFPIQPKIIWQTGRIKLPEIDELGAMKAYALSRRSQWKDYVDLFFLLKVKLSIDDIIAKAKQLFSNQFNTKLFREQLCYFDDIDFSETIDYFEYTPEVSEIKSFLEDIAIRI
jgi:hypothetical protein